MSQYSASASTTLSAIFDSQHDAQRAVDRLIEAGISRDSISLMPGYESDTPVAERREQHQGFFSALADFFMPDEDRYSYAEGLSRGGYLVAVSNLPSAHYDVALDILDDEGSIDLNEREESWRSEGWTGYQAGTSEALGYGAGTTAGSTTTSSTGSFGAASSTDYASDNTLSSRRDEDVIPVVDERLVVGKRDVNLGRVRVRSYIREEGVSENVNLHEERVNIERRPVDRPVSDADIAFQDRTIEAEEHAEQAVVGKEARVTEEIALRKDVSDRQETINDTVRKTEVEIEDDRDALDRQNLNRR